MEIGSLMNVNAILFELHSELRRIDQAILALKRLGPVEIGYIMENPPRMAAVDLSTDWLSQIS
jgi:hypothetical protein